MTVYETIDHVLKLNNKKWSDIQFISTKVKKEYSSRYSIVESYYIDVDEFIQVVKNLKFDRYEQNINQNIEILGSNWILKRRLNNKYPWEYVQLPEKPDKKLEIAKYLLNEKSIIGIES